MLSIYTNTPASNTAYTLNAHYAALATSTKRLSTGLRVNSASDDAAGLAIRELMRADIAASRQGVRNANDAISMLQVADGALGIIDEKLIRMKELAEQAATGTYDSTQRLMISSEFQAMASEIDRIANATDFNGIKLLNGSLSGEHDGTGLTVTGKMKIHFGTMNDSAEDYYYVEIGQAGTKGLGLRDPGGGSVETISPTAPAWILENAVIDYEQKKIFYDIPYRRAGLQDNSPNGVQDLVGIDYYQLPVGLEKVRIVSDATAPIFAHKPHVSIFTKSGEQLTGIDPAGKYQFLAASPDWPNSDVMDAEGSRWWAEKDRPGVVSSLIAAGLLDRNATYSSNIAGSAGQSVTAGQSTITMETNLGMYYGNEIITIDKVSEDLVFLIGGHAGQGSTNCNHYKLSITADLGDEFFERYGGGSVAIEDDGVIMSIETQEKAQKALTRVNDAIVAKDKIRAHLGALQNRLENTATNLTIQQENLQSAEARISDTDVAVEMTTFVRNQVLTQASVAMLAQANSTPQILARLLTD